MPFIQKSSNTNEDLAELFALSLRDQVSIFTPVFIGIENTSTQDWLIDQVVYHNEIAANLAFKKPQACIEIVYKVLCKETERQERILPTYLNWLIYALLEEEKFKLDFPEVADYYKEDALKRFTLSEKISALFTKYQELDADLIERLENGLFKENEHEEWQSYLWKEVVRRTEGRFISVPKMYDSIREALKHEDKIELLQQKVPQIRFYGTILYTREFVHLLKELGEHIHIELFRINTPAANGSKLLENLSPFQIKQSELFQNSVGDDNSKDSKPPKDNLLGAIQQELKGESKSNYRYNKIDDSIQIANNFSVYREVESLWNYLVSQFGKNKELQQRDICVIIPDIEKYAPAIKAIFGNDQLKIDFTFYDPSYKIQDSPYKALLALFALEKSEFTSKQVFGLLEFNYIRKKFGFTEDLETVKRAIGLANIRHDIEGDKDLDTNLGSWRYGLKRLIYGACIEKTDELLDFENETFYPVSEFEDRDLTNLIRLDYFVETLHDWLVEKKNTRSITDWTILLEKTIEAFLAIDEYEPTQFNRQLGTLMKVGELLEAKEVTYSVFHYNLKQLFENLEITEKIGFGGIRFVSPNPYINSSSKIYCFLGMNGNDFPRKNNKLSFDLLEDKKEYTTSQLDKNMFLNFLAGAKEKIYISYIGQSVKDNSSIPPSTLIDDLLATCSNYGLHEDSLGSILVKHPLHAFSSKYNDENDRLIRFESATKKVDLKKVETKEQFPPYQPEVDKDGKIIIPLSDLIRFIEDPVRHYYNRVLGIYYSDNEVELAECEPFFLDPLAHWSLKNDLLKNEIDPTELEDFKLENQRMGILPLLNFGTMTLNNAHTEVAEIASKILETIAVEKSAVTINIDCDKYRIIGEVDDVYDSTYIFSTVSSDKFKYQIRALVNYNFLKFQKQEITTGFYITKDSKKGSVKKSINLFDDIQKRIKNLCDLYMQGSKELIHFTSDFKDLSVNKMEKIDGGKALNEYFLKSLNTAFNTNYPSNYFMVELNNGFLSEKKAFENFKKIYNDLIGMLENGFKNK
jgi:exodeoxyribonuclease V gamma subunit